MFKKLFALVILLAVVSFEGTASALPPINGWSWPQILDYVESQAASPGAGCKVWLDQYGTTAYRLWKRCGVSSTAAGTSRESVNWNGWTGTIPGSPGDHPAGPQVCFWSVTGSTLGASCDISVSGTNVLAAGFSWSASGGTAGTISNPQQQIYEKIVMSCVGVPIAGSVAASSTMPVRPSDYHSRTPGSTSRVLGVNSGSIAGGCLAADTLVIDFGNVASPTCTQTNEIVSNVRGRQARAGSCSCIPLNFGIDEYYPPDTCLFRNIVGDPASLGTSEASNGSQSDNGYTFTNADLVDLPSGVNGVPIFGGEVGAPDNWGMTGTGGHTGSAADSGTGFKGEGNNTGSSTAPGTGSSGGGGTGGTGDCTDPACEGQEGGVVPGVPTYNTDLVTPTEDDWVSAITGWFGTSPFSSLFSGAAMNTSSASCVLTGATIKGASMAWDICSIPGLDLFPPILAALAHLCAIFIVFRR